MNSFPSLDFSAYSVLPIISICYFIISKNQHLRHILNLNLLNELFGRITNVNTACIKRGLLNVQIYDYAEH